MLKSKPFLQFLRYNHLQTYIELSQRYSELMQHVYDDRLKQYFRDTARLIGPQKDDFIAGLSFDQSRFGILERLTAQPIVTATSQQRVYYFEEVFRSQNKLIVDTVCKEFVFVLELFDLKMSQVGHMFNCVFAKVVNRYLKWLEEYAVVSSVERSDVLL